MKLYILQSWKYFSAM